MTRIVIAGAGIGGLSAALMLARQGVETTVLERRSFLAETGAGLQLSPNATRHLRNWGLLHALERVATRLEAIRILRARDAAELACMPLAAAHRFDAPFLVLHRAELQRVLSEAVVAEPRIDLRLGAEVASVMNQNEGIAVTVRQAAGAPVLRAEAFVNAGGLRPPAMSGDAAAPPRFSGSVAWRALIPAQDLPAAFGRPESNLWLGPRAHLVHYPLRGGTIVNVVAIVADRQSVAEAHDLWSEPGDGTLLAERFKTWHRSARMLIDVAETWHVWPLFDRPPGAAWSVGPATRLGDAAHPMMPFLAQGASQTIEDAAELAEAVAASPSDIAGAFRRYEKVRRPRAERVQQASRHQGRIYHLDGLAGAARDAVMRMLGSQAMLTRMDWIYGDTHGAGRSSRGRIAL